MLHEVWDGLTSRSVRPVLFCCSYSADGARGALMHVYAARGMGVMMIAKPKLVHQAHLSDTVGWWCECECE